MTTNAPPAGGEKTGHTADHPWSFGNCTKQVAEVWSMHGEGQAKWLADAYQRNLGWSSDRLMSEAASALAQRAKKEISSRAAISAAISKGED